ncbi:MAG TPA: hypothetical protein VEA61_03915 [Allosphingosinicella sp.]|nr:hypothetical protein [Allosphingosinicella sp.]
MSARELPKLVSAAVKAASARVQGADTGPSSGALVLKWELVGRRARSLAQGEELAAAITAELGKSGFKAQPAVLGVGKEIICGFFEPPNVPLARDL